MMVLDDFVMLGKTVPEPSRDNRIRVCSAGYSETYGGLLRIYPLAKRSAPPTWSVSTVKLERPPRQHDSRPESFKLAGDRRPGAHQFINRTFEVESTVAKAIRASLLRRVVIPSIAEANRQNLSLGIVHAKNYELEFEHNASSPDSPQLALFDLDDEIPEGARRFPYIPRLHFDDADGHHRLQLREWGVYELMRKHDNFTQMSEGERRKYLGGALHLDSSCSLLVGNLNNQRNAWLVISVLRGLRPAVSLLDELEAA